MKGIENVTAVAAKVEVAGTCVGRFEPVRAAFLDNLDTGQDIGAAVAVFVDGEPVVDLWGGHFDATYTRPLATARLVKWLNDVICSPLDQSSAPVRASSA